MTEPIDDPATRYSLRAVLDHSPEIVAAAVAGVLNVVALVLAVLLASKSTGPIIAGTNAALLPVLKVFVVGNRSVATAPLGEFADAVADAQRSELAQVLDQPSRARPRLSRPAPRKR